MILWRCWVCGNFTERSIWCYDDDHYECRQCFAEIHEDDWWEEE